MPPKKSTPRRKQHTQSPKPKKAPGKKSYMPKKGHKGGKTIAGPGY